MICICFLATLYHVSVPVRTNWSFNLPGATFSLVAWVLGSYVLRWVLTVTAADSRSIYGPLAAPIAVLIWLYIVAIAVLIGAAVNAAFDTVFPQKTTTRARLELMNRLRNRSRGPRLTGSWPRRLDSARALEPAGRPGRQGRVALPERPRSPWWELSRRLLAALAILVGTVLLVYFDRERLPRRQRPARGTASASSTRSTTRRSR